MICLLSAGHVSCNDLMPFCWLSHNLLQLVYHTTLWFFFMCHVYWQRFVFLLPPIKSLTFSFLYTFNIYCNDYITFCRSCLLQWFVSLLLLMSPTKIFFRSACYITCNYLCPFSCSCSNLYSMCSLDIRHFGSCLRAICPETIYIPFAYHPVWNVLLPPYLPFLLQWFIYFLPIISPTIICGLSAGHVSSNNLWPYCWSSLL